jgi:hypothetical protein
MQSPLHKGFPWLWAALFSLALGLFFNASPALWNSLGMGPSWHKLWGTKLSPITLAACGDVMMQNVDAGRPINDQALMSFMAAASPWFKSADIGFVNLEGPVGGSQPKPCSSANCYRFRQGPLTPSALAAHGVNLASLANNHANDMGPSGHASTLASLDQAGVRGAGLPSRPSTRWTQSGRSIEMLAFTANSFAPDFRRPEALAAISQAKARSDLVLVSVHMGCEGESCARLQGGREIYLGEDRGDPKSFGAAAVDAGADLVLGSGPHVPRAMALRNGHLIAYSLGNCAVGPGISSAGKAGWAPVLWTALDGQGKLISWDVGSFTGNGSALALDPSQRALSWMAQATELDSGPAQWRALSGLWKPAPARTLPWP